MDEPKGKEGSHVDSRARIYLLAIGDEAIDALARAFKDQPGHKAFSEAACRANFTPIQTALVARADVDIEAMTVNGAKVCNLSLTGIDRLKRRIEAVHAAGRSARVHVGAS